MKPMLFEEEEKNKPPPGNGLEPGFLSCAADFKNRINTGTKPKIYTIPKNTDPQDQAVKVAGCWYGAPVVFLPPVHNLPLGFVMNPTYAKEGKNIKEAIRAFFEIPAEDSTYNFLDSPYINSWCRMMSQSPDEFAQTAVLLKQVSKSWLAVVKPQDASSVSHSHQATFAHMECLLLHRIFRDTLMAGASKKWLVMLQKHEEILKFIFDKPESEEDEVQAESTNGTIEATNLDARLKGGTTNGRLVLENVHGGIQLETTNGSISAKYRVPRGQPAVINHKNRRVRRQHSTIQEIPV